MLHYLQTTDVYAIQQPLHQTTYIVLYKQLAMVEAGVQITACTLAKQRLFLIP